MIVMPEGAEPGSNRADRQRSVAALSATATACLLAAALCAPNVGFKPARAQAKPVATFLAVTQMIKQSCIGCHQGKTAGGGLDLSILKFSPAESRNFALWVKIHDKVEAGEMPPKGAAQPTASARKTFLTALSQPLTAFDDSRIRSEGRSRWRRMNRLEYENSLRDLLEAPWLQVKEMLPEDGLAFHMNKVGEALDVSHVQMNRYLNAADYALREAMSPQTSRPETTVKRYYARDMSSFAGLARREVYEGEQERLVFAIVDNIADTNFLSSGTRTASADPSRREHEAMGMVASSYEPTQPYFDHFHAPISGRYKLRLCAHSFWANPNSKQRWWHPSLTSVSAGRTQEPVTLYALQPPQQLRKLGDVDFGPESSTHEIDVELLKGETILPDPARFFRSRPPGWHNPLAEKDGQPGVAFQWLEAEGPILDSWPPRGHQLLFGSLPTKDTGGRVEAVSANTDADSRKLLRGFMQRALRHPIQDAEVQPYIKLYQKASATGAGFTESMLTAYTGILCSPAFVTLEERPGALDDYALASRLSYFLWNSEPDSELRGLAAQHKLHQQNALLAQADRLLSDRRSQRFVDAFLDYWLDLRKTENASPDEVLYPDYYLDDYLVQSSIAESRAFFTELVQHNLPARNLVASDFVTVNDRLATLYGIPNVTGSAMRRVPLPADSVRGGMITQASVLKVTANGTTTSPVLRGVWINERILGQPVPIPPPVVPAVEPDIRGAKTIREQLAQHRTLPTCKNCHAKIDPAGFALENFDVFGGYRERYRALGSQERSSGFGKNGQPFVFHSALPVDATGELPDGRHFQDVRDLKKLFLQDERQIARNLASQLIIYSTGASVQFSDRPKVEAILNRAKPGGYGVKSLIHAIIDSDIFRDK